MNYYRATRIVETYQALRIAQLAAAASHSMITSTYRTCIAHGNTRGGVRFSLEREYTPASYRIVGRTRHDIRTDLAVVALLDEETRACLENILYIPSYYRGIPKLDILGIEIERRTTRKHLAGSVFYLASMYPRGMLVTDRTGEALRILATMGGEGRIQLVSTGDCARLCGGSFLL